MSGKKEKTKNKKERVVDEKNPGMKLYLGRTAAIRNKAFHEDVIPFFGHKYGRYKCFSQFCPSDFVFDLEDIPVVLLTAFEKALKTASKGKLEVDWDLLEEESFNCGEKFMMTGKCMVFDEGAYKKLKKLKDPKLIKAYGRKNIANFVPRIWDAVSIYWVLIGNYLKFSQNPEMAKILKKTGSDILVEASPYDRIWGIGLGHNHPNISNPNMWKGTNKLGEVLMQIREFI